jgi:hypothetical protein
MKTIRRMDSWKTIARYMNRDVATCMKWAKTYGLPVHRIDAHSKRSRVFAFKSEIDAWFEKRAKEH